MGPDISDLAPLGLPGLVVGWLLWHFVPRLVAIERELQKVRLAVDRLTRANMLTLIEREDTTDHLKAHARSVIAEIERADAEDAAEKATKS